MNPNKQPNKKKFAAIAGILLLAAFSIMAMPHADQRSRRPVDPSKMEGLSYAPELTDLINQVRSMPQYCSKDFFERAPAVQWDDNLAKAALDHAADMAKNKLKGHRGSDGSRLGERVKRYTNTFVGFGETISYRAYNKYNCVQRLMASEGHCKIFMYPNYTHIGAAKYRDPDGRMGEEGADIWVIKFARPQPPYPDRKMPTALDLRPLKNNALTLCGQPRDAKAENLRRELENAKINFEFRSVRPHEIEFYNTLKMDPENPELGVVMMGNKVFTEIFTLRELLEKINRKDYTTIEGEMPF